jgi:hypothetical protein
MKRETRANLIFIVLLVAATVPGGIMLVKKKLKAGANSGGMMMSDAVRRETAYMDPLPLPGFIRHVPPKTIAWVGQLADVAPHQEPILSERRTFEVAKIVQASQGWDATVLIWNTRPLDNQEPNSVLIVNGQDVAGELLESKQLSLPREIDNELRDMGFINPPKQIVLAKFHYPTGETPSALSLLGESARIDSLNR